MKIISLWSGPRNVSTALMYAAEQHSRIKVIDEPLYAHYLRITGADHPGRDEVLAAMENDGEKVLENILSMDADIIFLKNMAHHWIGLNDQWLTKFENIILTREPAEMLTSLVNQIPRPTLRDTGYEKQIELLKKLDYRVPIIISKDLLKNPKLILKTVCDKLQIEFEESMLSWPLGPSKSDGVWAKYWYHNVHNSTEFSPYKEKNQIIPDHLRALHKECPSYFNELKEYAIKPEDYA